MKAPDPPAMIAVPDEPDVEDAALLVTFGLLVAAAELVPLLAVLAADDAPDVEPPDGITRTVVPADVAEAEVAFALALPVDVAPEGRTTTVVPADDGALVMLATDELFVLPLAMVELDTEELLPPEGRMTRVVPDGLLVLLDPVAVEADAVRVVDGEAVASLETFADDVPPEGKITNVVPEALVAVLFAADTVDREPVIVAVPLAVLLADVAPPEGKMTSVVPVAVAVDAAELETADAELFTAEDDAPDGRIIMVVPLVALPVAVVKAAVIVVEALDSPIAVLLPKMPVLVMLAAVDEIRETVMADTVPIAALLLLTAAGETVDRAAVLDTEPLTTEAVAKLVAAMTIVDPLASVVVISGALLVAFAALVDAGAEVDEAVDEDAAAADDAEAADDDAAAADDAEAADARAESAEAEDADANDCDDAADASTDSADADEAETDAADATDAEDSAARLDRKAEA